MGIGHAELLDGDRPMAFVVSKMGLHFLKPARIDDQLVVRTHYDAIKGPRLLISQSVTRGDETLCRAEVEVVCIHMDGRPRRPTPALREKVGPWLAREA
jgi:acyl-CoA thioester hydrolase